LYDSPPVVEADSIKDLAAKTIENGLPFDVNRDHVVSLTEAIDNADVIGEPVSAREIEDFKKWYRKANQRIALRSK
jgi:hypothetical protein